MRNEMVCWHGDVCGCGICCHPGRAIRCHSRGDSGSAPVAICSGVSPAPPRHAETTDQWRAPTHGSPARCVAAAPTSAATPAPIMPLLAGGCVPALVGTERRSDCRADRIRRGRRGSECRSGLAWGRFWAGQLSATSLNRPRPTGPGARESDKIYIDFGITIDT